MNHTCKKCNSENVVLVEYAPGHPDRYDGISEIVCKDCNARFGRWSGKELMEEEMEAQEKLEEMKKIVEAKEKADANKISKEADADFKVEEGRGRRESREERFARESQEKLYNWVPKTQLGKDVRARRIKNIDEIFDKGLKIMEPEIVELLVPGLRSDTLFIGQAKGKFGGGKRRAFRQTQKKTKEGNVLTFGEWLS